MILKNILSNLVNCDEMTLAVGFEMHEVLKVEQMYKIFQFGFFGVNLIGSFVVICGRF